MTVYEVYEAAELSDHGEYGQALELLETIDFAQRDAKWCHEYCRASAGLERYFEAAQAAKKAHELEPDNEIYQKDWKAYRKYRRPKKEGKHFSVLDGCCDFGCCDCGCECCCEGCCEGICDAGCDCG